MKNYSFVKSQIFDKAKKYQHWNFAFFSFLTEIM